MSTANPPTESELQVYDDFDCGHPDCDATEPQTDHGAPVDAYCSRECRARHRGRGLLNLLKHDHRFCFTCFRQVKEVEHLPELPRLGPITKDALTGLQFRTEHGEIGETYLERPPGIPNDSKQGTICTCGQTGHQDREPVIRKADVKATVLNLIRAVDVLGEEDQHDHDIDDSALVAELRRQHEETGAWDWPLAVGRAITSSG